MLTAKVGNGHLSGQIFGALLLLIAAWACYLAIRMIANRPGRGLLGPFALRCASALFFLLPVAGLLTGYTQEHPYRAALQSVSYWVVAFALWRLAKVRRAAV